MNRSTTRSFPVLGLLLALALAIGTQAVSARSAAAPATIAPADPPLFPNCSVSVPTTYTNLQVFLLIDDSGSMLSSDPRRQRIEGAKNVLDILAKEYYLPAVDARARDADIELPDIQVSLIHFSAAAGKPSGWKKIDPQTVDEWTSQLKAFDADLAVMKPGWTDFHTAFNAAAELADRNKPASGDRRILMLFTDGVPNLGNSNLSGQVLADYMRQLQGIFKHTFNRSNDSLFVTAFGSDAGFRRYWDKQYSQHWGQLTQDSDQFDPRRVQYVPTKELASRMERIVGSAIGSRVYVLSPVADKPQQFITEIPVAVESLRLTYYTVQASTSFTVTGPDGKAIQPDGKSAIRTDPTPSIHVLEILHPAPGSYQISTSSAGGLLTELLRFEEITAKFTSPIDPVLQFTNGQLRIQLFGADGAPLAISPRITIQAVLTRAGQSNSLALKPESDAFTTSWMPTTTDKATVSACIMLMDSAGVAIAPLFNGQVGEINVDPVAVQAAEAQACETDKEVGLPLQLINASSQKPAFIDAPLNGASCSTSPGGARLACTIAEVDAASGQYILHYKTPPAGKVQTAVTTSAVVSGQNYPVRGVIATTVQPIRQLKMTLGSPPAKADTLSIALYRAFHPGCLDENTRIVVGRHFFGLFGPSQVRVSGRFIDVGNNLTEPGIERFAVQLVSSTGGPSSDTLSTWAAPQKGNGFSTLQVRSPGLGLYRLTITDQGKDPVCAVLVEAPSTQTLLLINDYWEYLIFFGLILCLMFLVFYLLRRYRDRRWGHEVPLILSSIVLLGLNFALVNLLATQTFKCQLNCAFLIDRTLNSDTLCKGVHVSVPPERIVLIPAVRPLAHTFLSGTFLDVRTPELAIDPIPIVNLPGLRLIDPPLEALRKFVSWTAIAFLALTSLAVAFLATKVKNFINLLLTSEGRASVLTYLSVWLLFFVVFCVFFVRRLIP